MDIYNLPPHVLRAKQLKTKRFPPHNISNEFIQEQKLCGNIGWVIELLSQLSQVVWKIKLPHFTQLCPFETKELLDLFWTFLTCNSFDPNLDDLDPLKPCI